MRIKLLRSRLGLTQNEFAEQLGVTQATVSRWESGAEPEQENLVALANLEGISLDEFTGRVYPAPLKMDSTEVLGAVQAGTWSTALEWPPDRRYQVFFKPVSTYREIKTFGLEVLGSSMDKVYPPGSVLICVKLLDLHRELRSGERVIVYQVRGDEIEATAKEYIVDEEGQIWLWPRSNDPRHQTPLTYPTPGTGVDEIRIHAVVIGSYRPE